MLSTAQRKEKEMNISRTVKAFLETKKSNEELSKELGISSSSVGRYLNDEEYICELFGYETFLAIQQILEDNKKKALSKGGKVTQSRYYQTRDSIGKYTGNKAI